MGWGEEHTPAPRPDAEKALGRIHSVAQGALSQGAAMSVEDAAVHYADALRVLVAIAQRGGA